METTPLFCSCATFIGKRKNNQDNFIADGLAPFRSEKMNFSDAMRCPDQPVHLFAVCDGIGGLGDSAEISRRTVELLCGEFPRMT